MQWPSTIRKKLKELPDAPGVYLMRGRTGAIIYVGKAVSLRKRVQSYFRDSTYHKAEPKLRGLVPFPVPNIRELSGVQTPLHETP